MNQYDYQKADVSKVFDKLGVHVSGKDIVACHCLNDNDWAILKFSNKKRPITRFFVSRKTSNFWTPLN